MPAGDRADAAGDHDADDRQRAAAGERRGGDERRLARNGHAGAFDQQKERNQHIAIVGDPLAYDIEHPCVTDPGGGRDAGSRKLDGRLGPQARPSTKRPTYER